MSHAVLFLFPDTNLFAQCRALHELDWPRYEGFDEVRLMVSRPVQAEIDDQKNRGGDRLARRARAASTMFREIILSESGFRVIRQSSPSVKLFIEPQLRPAEGLNIDYSRSDDQLVGIAVEFQKQNPNAAVRLLTHDTGPMATALSVGVGLEPIPDEWLLPPESSETDKTIKALRDEVERLKSSGPLVTIVLAGRDDLKPVLEGEVVLYQPLSPNEVQGQMERIRQCLPIATDFNTPKPAKQKSPIFDLVYEPPSESEIDQYRASYFSWLTACEKALEPLHSWLQQNQGPDAQFAFEASNHGARPARDVLVTITARGNFKIQPKSDRHFRCRAIQSHRAESGDPKDSRI
jgi:hypothetical protein